MTKIGHNEPPKTLDDFLKRAREVRTGKTKKRREARKKYVEKQLDKADLPFWW